LTVPFHPELAKNLLKNYGAPPTDWAAIRTWDQDSRHYKIVEIASLSNEDLVAEYAAEEASEDRSIPGDDPSPRYELRAEILRRMEKAKC
jgi:hypothetical protein